MKCNSKTVKFEKRIIWKETPSHQECSTVLGENNLLTNIKNQLTGLHEKCDSNINNILQNPSVDIEQKKDILKRKLNSIGEKFPQAQMSFVYDLLPKKGEIDLGYSYYLRDLQSLLKSQMKIRKFPIDTSSLSEKDKMTIETLRTNIEELSPTIEKISFYEGEDEFLNYCNKKLIKMMYRHTAEELQKQKEKYGENF